MVKLIVTAAPPTSNGDLHLGHMSGPYLGADVFARVRRQMGDDVLCVSYSDDFQSYVQRKAFEQTGSGENLTERSRQVSRKFGQRMASSLKAAGIELDIFMHSIESDSLLPSLSTFFSAAEQQGLLAWEKVLAPYSRKHRVWGYEAFARGTCPNCGASTDTSQCETCAFPPIIDRMHDLRCVLDGSDLVPVEVEQIFLKVAEKRDFLRNQFASMNPRAPLREFCAKVLASDLPDWAISRPGDWGPELPAHPGSSLHTWFAGISGYRAASMDWAKHRGTPDAWRHYWEDSDTGIIHFVGIDCAFSHAVVYPILLSCLDEGPSVRQIYTNQFLTLNGLDFSTSRGLAIWAGEFFGAINQDAVRYYLALKSPELAKADFNLGDFEEITNSLFDRILRVAIQKISTADTGATMISDGLSDELATIKLADIRKKFLIASGIDSFSMSKIAECLRDLIVLLHLSNQRSVGQFLGLYAKLSRSLQPNFSAALSSALEIPDQWGNAWLLDDEPIEPMQLSADVRAKLAVVNIPFVDSTKIREFEACVADLAERKAAAHLAPAE